MTGKIAIAKKQIVINIAQGKLIGSPDASARTSFQARIGIMLIAMQKSMLEAKHNFHSFALKV